MGSVSTVGDKTKALERLGSLPEVLKKPELRHLFLTHVHYYIFGGTKLPGVQILPNFQTTFTPEQISRSATHTQAVVVSTPWSVGTHLVSSGL